MLNRSRYANQRKIAFFEKPCCLSGRLGLTDKMHINTSRVQGVIGIWTKVAADDRLYILSDNELRRLRTGSTRSVNSRVGRCALLQSVHVQHDKIPGAPKSRVNRRVDVWGCSSDDDFHNALIRASFLFRIWDKLGQGSADRRYAVPCDRMSDRHNTRLGLKQVCYHRLFPGLCLPPDPALFRRLCGVRLVTFGWTCLLAFSFCFLFPPAFLF